MKTIVKRMAPRSGLAATLIVALAAFAAGVLVRDLPPAAADVREEPTPKAFLSGSERSEVVLKEILATLNKMDGRLKHFEDVLDQAARR